MIINIGIDYFNSPALVRFCNLCDWKITILILFFCCAALPSFAQQKDSLFQKSDSLFNKLSSLDARNSTYQKKLDSLSSLKPSNNKHYKKLDSIRNGFSVEKLLSKRKLKKDSLRLPSIQSDSSVVKNKRKEVDSLKQSLSLKIDSIKAKGGDPLSVQKKTDSLQAVYNQAISKRLSILQQKGAKLTGEETQILEKVGVPQINMDVPTIPGLQLPETGNLPGAGLSKPEFEMPGVNMPQIEPDLNGVNAPQIKKLDIPGMPGEVGDAQNVLKKVNELGKQVGDVSKDVDRLKEEGIEEVKNTDVDKLAEQGLTKIDGVNELKSQADAAEKMKLLQQQELDKIKNAQSMRDQLSSKLATDKILANEEQVKEYMEKMAKHKKKFDNLPDMRYVPKIKPNEMKGKPLKERIVPGLLIQIQKDNNRIAWYLAPEVLYKFSGTFSAGLGGLYRLQYTTTPKMIWNDPVYGYKLIGQAKLYKGFYTRTEFERNSFIFPVNSVDGKRIWQSNWLIGLGRTQKISNRLNGHFWAFYNLDRDPQDIFKGRVILKTGIQFNLVNYRKKFEDHITEKMKRQRAYDLKKNKEVPKE